MRDFQFALFDYQRVNAKMLRFKTVKWKEIPSNGAPPILSRKPEKICPVILCRLKSNSKYMETASFIQLMQCSKQRHMVQT